MFSQFWHNTQYFNPKQVTGLRLWLDATDPAANGTQPADGTAVSTWTDKSGQANNVTQATGSLQPIYKLNIINAKPVVRFDGVDDLLSKTSASTLGTKATMFAVVTTNGNTRVGAIGRGTFGDYSTNAATNTGMNLLNNGSVDGGPFAVAGWFAGALNQAIGSTTLTLPFTGVFSAYNDGSNGFVLLNGTQDGTVAVGNISGTPNVYTIGSLFGGLIGWHLNGDIAEILFYTGQVSAAQQTLITRYLGNKWGITVA